MTAENQEVEEESEGRYEFPATVRLLNNPVFKAQLLGKLESRLHNSPDSKTYQSIVDVYRRSGDLKLAAQTAKTWAEFAPEDEKVAYLARVLGQESIVSDPYNPSDIKPAPFAIVDNFLKPKEREFFWQLVTDSTAKFGKEGVLYEKASKVDTNKRDTDVLRLNKKDKAWMRERVGALVDELFDRFLIPIQPVKKIEAKVTAHAEGGFFHIHQDGFVEIGGSSRNLSWVYYFHDLPKRYTGGELVLFDSNVDEEVHKFNTLNYTRYVPEDNQIVFFPSWYFHGVTPVHFLKPGFASSRFAVAGHVRC